MDAVIAQTCSVVALAIVTVWAIVAADTSRDDSESDSPRGRPSHDCEPDICSRVRCRSITEEECPPSKGTIDLHGGFCGCCPACVPRTPANPHC